MSVPDAQASSGATLALFVVASMAVIALAAVGSRWLANWQSIQTRGRRLRVLEGVPIGKDRQLLLVSVGREVLVLGSSSSGVSLVHKVEEPGEVAALMSDPPAPQREPASAQTALEESVRTNLTRMRSLLSRAGGGRDA